MQALDLANAYYDKIFKTRKEAKRAELNSTLRTALLNFATIRASVSLKWTVMSCFRTYITTFGGIWLNQHRQFVIQKMNAKAKEYANFKVIRCYINQVLDLAEEYEYIEFNRLSKSLKKIKSVKKNHLRQTTNEEDKYLTDSQLPEWFKAVQEDLDHGQLSYQDYILF